jgi:hypothetical protein
MLEHEKERGKRLANLSRQEKDDLVAQLMFGQQWQRAREAMQMLMHIWGISAASVPEAEGSEQP